MNYDLLKEQIIQVFSEGGNLEKHVGKRYRANELQLDYALSVARTLCNGEKSQQCQTALLEAETGIGKTLGYLIPVCLWAVHNQCRIAVSTYTTQLQHQLCSRKGDVHLALDIVKEMTGRQLNYAVRKGLSNYISHRKVQLMWQKVQSESLTKQEKKHWQSFLTYVNSHDLIDDWLESGSLPVGITIDDITLTSSLSAEEKSQYLHDVDKAKTADVIIVNHAILLLHAFSQQILNSRDDGARTLKAVIIDEADRVPKAAQSLLSRQMSLHTLSDLIEENMGSHKILELLDNTVSAIQEMDNGKSRLFLNDVPQTFSKHIHHLHQQIQAIGSQFLQDDDIDDQVKESFSRVHLGIATFLDIIDNKSKQLRAAIAFSDTHRHPSLLVIPTAPEGAINALWKRCEKQELKTVVFTSATMSDGTIADLNRTALDWGLVRDAELCEIERFEPSCFGSMDFILINKNHPGPTQADTDESFTKLEWLSNSAKLIQEAFITEHAKHALVLTTSYADCRSIAELLAGKQNVIEHRTDTLFIDVVEKFKASKEGILITPTGWEGLNLPGFIDLLVITRLPYLPPNDSRLGLKEQLSNQYGEKEASKIAYAKDLIATKRKLRQAFGRPIRGSKDKVTVLITDPRFPHFSETNNTGLISCIPVRFRDNWKNARVGHVTMDKVFFKQPEEAKNPW